MIQVLNSPKHQKNNNSTMNDQLKRKTKITADYLKENNWEKYPKHLEWFIIVEGVSSPIRLELNIEEESAFIDDHVIQMDNIYSLETLILILRGKDLP